MLEPSTKKFTLSAKRSSLRKADWGREDKRQKACPVCGTLFPDCSEVCPVCVLHGALEPENGTGEAVCSELRFEHYQVLKSEDGTPIELGRGAMGVTYKALDVDLRRPVTLKVIHARYLNDESARLRFLREARGAASVRYPNVASVFHLGKSGENYFYAMEFVDGETLEKLLRNSSRLDWEMALEIVSQIAAGLAAIQKQHLVHRDIKPSNIMVRLQGDRVESVQVIDLGLAKPVEDSASNTGISVLGSFVGTPEYASPEQFSGVRADIRSDLYSLGVTLWEMSTGGLPFSGSPAELMHQHQHGTLPMEKLTGTPQPIRALLEVLLEKDPARRFQDPAELVKVIPLVIENNPIGTASHCGPIASNRSGIGRKSGRLEKVKLSIHRCELAPGGLDRFGAPRHRWLPLRSGSLFFPDIPPSAKRHNKFSRKGHSRLAV
jgi:serine/threonine protein kinase